ncbi:MAG: caspase family protein [Deltaproteobacteria bacterium]|nr:caspase family protein [Deltaproteobacteria bacterium]
MLVVLAGTAAADPAVTTYALVVGSNTGGPGQTDLHYAEDDARHVGSLLAELGGYTPDSIDVLVHPTPDELRDRLSKLAVRVAADQAAGRQSRVFFYYSGHARAAAIDLGDTELPLVELRTRLFEIPATLTVVVLDACQSGAFSRVKGAQPAADFSVSSREHLDAQGVAVLASSSGSELSQESEQLRSSYFTHHFMVGLRGAADANHDGQVSLDEAYRYAYHQTLMSTAETAVGGQHVSLEVELKGHGEVPLSYPVAATSSIVLPASLEGQALVEDKRAHTVVAETYKAKGAAVRIAVAPGEYEVVVRHGTSLSRCEIASGAVDLDRCSNESIVVATTKGGGFLHRTQIEVGVLIGGEREDGYTDSLKGFGYNQEGLTPSAGFEARGMRRVAQRVWVGGLASWVTMPKWSQAVSGSNLAQTLEWKTAAAMALARGVQPIGESHFSLYGELATGLGIGHTTLTNSQGMTFDDYHVGPAFVAGAGLHIESPFLHDLGVSAGYEFDYMPVISDLIGNTHASGGHRLTFALTYGF